MREMLYTPTHLLGQILVLLLDRERRVQIPTHIPPDPSIIEPPTGMIPPTSHIRILHEMLVHQFQKVVAREVDVIVVDDCRPGLAIGG